MHEAFFSAYNTTCVSKISWYKDASIPYYLNGRTVCLEPDLLPRGTLCDVFNKWTVVALWVLSQLGAHLNQAKETLAPVSSIPSYLARCGWERDCWQVILEYSSQLRMY